MLALTTIAAFAAGLALGRVTRPHREQVRTEQPRPALRLVVSVG